MPINHFQTKALLTTWFILLANLNFSTLIAQEAIDATKQNYISQLSQGFLLVRLHTASKTIAAMRQRGLVEEAERLEKEKREKNLEILKTFTYAYTFSPVYFIWSDSSHLIASEEPVNLPLLNENLEIDPGIIPKGTQFLVGDFGTTEPGASGLTVSGFVLRSRNLKQLPELYPYVTRSYEGLPHERSVVQVVTALNKKLGNY